MSKATILPIYHHPLASINHHDPKNNSLIDICDYILRTKKFKILGITFGIFLCSLWVVAHVSGSGFNIHNLRYYNKNNKAAIAAAWVLGEGGEEGIHGLEVENHGRVSANGHSHGVHEPLEQNNHFNHYIDFTSSSQNHPNVAQQRFEEALKQDMYLDDLSYIEPQSKLELEVNELVHEHKIVIFSKSYCPYSKKANNIFSLYNIDPHPFIIEVDERDDADEVKQTLIKFTYQSTFPNIFVDGRSIGGSEDLVIMHLSGRLEELLMDAGVLIDYYSHPAL
ncbi:4080_t:CDS:2 [Funneliformis geosporum]|uniref:16147_t:CDS:1 n=1 Tax=Funneliformis geosporum TaxID=1117311 RepID=A0A9W4SQL3_9GLOM|nr:4080_t:CDS:2 [Funneliformis geosporum]CAI2178022.1 16147_t:CDS:2 [Funneliformis geosporum]